MPKLYVLIGPPGIGKSTWAKANVGGNAVRINRDEMRSMLQGRYVYGNARIEKMVTKISYDIAREAFANNMDVILDNTNCNIKTIRQLIQEVSKDIDIKWVVFKLPYWKQRLRIIKRWLKGGPWIRKEVSVNMNKGYEEVVAFLKDRTGKEFNFMPHTEVRL